MKDIKSHLKPEVINLLRDDKAAQRIQEVIEAGIEIDAYGMVVPQVQLAKIRDKITKGLVDTRTRLAQVLGEGKHVIYLPGSYDMIHSGHASYVLQGVEAYLDKHSRLSRQDIFVMMLADDDELIESELLYLLK